MLRRAQSQQRRQDAGATGAQCRNWGWATL